MKYEITAVIVRVPDGSPLAPGRSFVLASETLVGRAHEASVRLDDVTVSRRHAQMRLSEGLLIVEAISANNGTFINGVRVPPGTPVTVTMTTSGLAPPEEYHSEDQVPPDGEMLLQVGGVLLQVSRSQPTRPIQEPLSVPVARLIAPTGGFLHLHRDGDGCTVRCTGRYLEVPAAAARVLWELARESSRVVHQWELQDAAGAEANLPQLVSQLRRAFRQVLAEGWLDRRTLERMIRSAASGQRLENIEELDEEALMRRLILSRRNHGYILCIPPSAVVLETV